MSPLFHSFDVVGRLSDVQMTDCSKTFLRFFAGLLCFVSLSVEAKEGKPAAKPQPQIKAHRAYAPSGAAIQFAKGVVKLGKHTIEVEIADSLARQRQGLMNRDSLPEGKGMLFIYKYEDYLTFWMKNTLIPLSIAFFNEDKELLEILDMEVEPLLILDSKRKRYRSKSKAKYALEVPKGWFRKKGISPDKELAFELVRASGLKDK